jgi:glutamate 5-kinase
MHNKDSNTISWLNDNDAITLAQNKHTWVHPFAQAKRVVIKLGSSLITNNGIGVDENLLNSLAQQIHALQQKNMHVILVSSGAVACGMAALNLTDRPKQTHELQATAAIGQMHLMHRYHILFENHKLKAAQVLLTHADFSDRERYLNIRGTINTLLDLNIVPIINENDVVATDEIRFGDNDTLGALVASLIDADILCILTDQQGIYTADPRRDSNAKRIQYAYADDKNLAACAGAAGSVVGTGGMLTKVLAAQRAAQKGIHTCIAYGKHSNVLNCLAQGQSIGSLLIARQSQHNARKQWMLDHLKLNGHVYIDEGAAQALADGKSLLPIGMLDVIGAFNRGDVIACYCQGQEIARGITQYNSTEAKLIAKQASKNIESILGYNYANEMIHRNDLVYLMKYKI